MFCWQKIEFENIVGSICNNKILEKAHLRVLVTWLWIETVESSVQNNCWNAFWFAFSGLQHIYGWKTLVLTQVQRIWLSSWPVKKRICRFQFSQTSWQKIIHIVRPTAGCQTPRTWTVSGKRLLIFFYCCCCSKLKIYDNHLFF